MRVPVSPEWTDQERLALIYAISLSIELREIVVNVGCQLTRMVATLPAESLEADRHLLTRWVDQ